jgi:hypothetical protein
MISGNGILQTLPVVRRFQPQRYVRHDGFADSNDPILDGVEPSLVVSHPSS